MKRSIVAADDSVGVHRALEEALGEDAGLESFYNGADAWSRIEDGPLPDLVVVDVHMPGIGGLELAGRIKEAHPDLPVLVLVGTFEPFDGEAFTRSGADQVLKKPAAVPELRERVTSLLGGDVERDPARQAPEDERLEIGVEPEPVPKAEVETSPPPGGDDFSEVETAIYDEPPIPLPAVSPKPEVRSDEDDPTPSDEREQETPAPEDVPVSEAVPAPAEPRSSELSDAEVDRIARRMVELAGDGVLREVAWEVVPDLAEVLIRERLERLERELEESS